jgi:NADH-quinone oxidoreductase subunit F
MKTYDELKQAADAVWALADRPTRPLISVGIATCSIAYGAERTLGAIRAAVQDRGLDCDVGITSCYGFCFAEPTVTVTRPDGARVLYGPVTADRAGAFLDAIVERGEAGAEFALGTLSGSVTGVQPIAEHIFSRHQVRQLMALCGVIDPENTDHAVANGAYRGLSRALKMSQDDLIKYVLDSGLWGRGGAAFPAGRKWEFLKAARKTPKYIACNADEGDPGAFVNRELMEGDPHITLEGMAIAGHAAGAEIGYIYIREEYPLAYKRIKQAVEQATARGLLGDNIFGSGTNFEIRVVRGAGSYVCGEETGMISSIQDSRGMPRIKPPFPANAGLWGLPTNVNNVETLANAPIILRNGVPWFREQGTQRNPGTKMFTFTGDIKRVGCVEVPFGTSMRALLEENFGGLPQGRTLKAIQPGGPLGGIMPAEGVSVGLEPEPFRDYGVMMGGGGLIMFDDTTCIVDMAQYFTWFAEDESCGRCTTCHGGTQRITEILRRIQDGGGRMSDIELMKMVVSVLPWSNCFHGQGAPAAVSGLMRHFAAELETHIRERRCPAQVCRGLITYEVVPECDTNVAEGAAICPTNAIKQRDGHYFIDQSLCIKCNACKELNPEAIRVVDAFVSRPAALAAAGGLIPVATAGRPAIVAAVH